LLFVGQPELNSARQVGGVNLQSDLALCDGLIVLPGEIILARKTIVEEWRVRIEFLRAFGLPQAFFGPAQLHQVMGVPMMRVGVIWVQFDGALELAFRTAPV